jgi:F-box associated protein
MLFTLKDITENIITKLDIKDIKNFIKVSKTIKSHCNDKRIWSMILINQHMILFKDIKCLTTVNEFIEACYVYNSYVKQATRIYNYCIENNEYIDVYLYHITAERTRELNRFMISQMTDNPPQDFMFIEDNAVKLSCDFHNQVFIAGNIKVVRALTISKLDKLLYIIAYILYFFPDLELLLGDRYGRTIVSTQFNITTNIKMDNMFIKRANILAILK